MEALQEMLFGSLQTLVTLTLLLSIRVAVMLVMLPAPFGQTAPSVVRAALSVLIAWALAVPAMPGAVPVELAAVPIARSAFGEAVVGAVLGISARVTLAAAEIAGSFAGFSMGLGFASSIDPMLGEQSLPTSRLLSSFATLVFFATGGHHVLLAALVATVESAPPGAALSGLSTDGVIGLGSEMVQQGLRIAAPVIATLFIVQLGMGLVSRSAPKVQIFILSFAVVSGCGLIALYVSAPSVATAIQLEIRQIPARVTSVLGS